MVLSKTQFITSLLLLMIILPSSASAETIVDETINISGLSIDGYSFTTEQDNIKISVSVEVTSGNDITLFIADRANALKAYSLETFEYYLLREDIVQGNYDTTLGSEGTYDVILDNLDSLTGVTVAIKIDLESTTDYIIYLVIIGVVVIVGIYLWRRRKKSKEI